MHFLSRRCRSDHHASSSAVTCSNNRYSNFDSPSRLVPLSLDPQSGREHRISSSSPLRTHSSCNSTIVMSRFDLRPVVICFLLLACLSVGSSHASASHDDSTNSSASKLADNDEEFADASLNQTNIVHRYKAVIQSRSAEESPYYDRRFSPLDNSPTEFMPTFDHSAPHNVTTGLNYLASLRCRVRNLQNRMVSWIRTRDFHVLTVGKYTYTTDQRFSAQHNEKTGDWTLVIKYTQLTDIGKYECQVSSVPKVSYFVTLNVVVPKTDIRGAPDLYVKSGSSIRLECIVSQSPQPPAFVFWYHNNRMINFDVGKRRRLSGSMKVSETTDTNPGHQPVSAASGNNKISSIFTIDDAQPKDSGNYTCSPSNAKMANITVHVLDGEKPAAMQDNDETSGSTKFHPIVSQLGVCFLCYLRSLSCAR